MIVCAWRLLNPLFQGSKKCICVSNKLACRSTAGAIYLKQQLSSFYSIPLQPELKIQTDYYVKRTIYVFILNKLNYQLVAKKVPE